MHCRGHNDTKNYKVTLGELDTKDEEDSEQEFRVRYLKRHPLFVLEGYFNDIMLLKVRFLKFIKANHIP